MQILKVCLQRSKRITVIDRKPFLLWVSNIQKNARICTEKCTYSCAHVWALWKAWIDAMFSSLILHVIIWDRVSHWTSSSPHWSASLRVACFCLPGLGLQVCIPASSFSCGLWRAELQSSCLCSKHFAIWDLSPNPRKKTEFWARHLTCQA